MKFVSPHFDLFFQLKRCSLHRKYVYLLLKVNIAGFHTRNFTRIYGNVAKFMNNPRQTLQRIGLNFLPLFLTSLFCSRVMKEELDTDSAHEPIVKVRLELQGYVFSLLTRSARVAWSRVSNAKSYQTFCFILLQKTTGQMQKVELN